jgi:hypothetical protein
MERRRKKEGESGEEKDMGDGIYSLNFTVISIHIHKKRAPGCVTFIFP